MQRQITAAFIVFSGMLFTLISSGLAAQEPTLPWVSGQTSPNWHTGQVHRKIRHTYDDRQNDQANGLRLKHRIEDLQPGDMLLIAPGRYSIGPKLVVDLQGTPQAPIWIIGSSKEQPTIITRPDARQNVMNVGERKRTEYVCFQNVEFTGGSTLIRFYDCHHVWLDRCHLHHAGAEGITANTRDTQHLFITNNHFHDFKNPNATGEAMYLGANQGKAKMSYSVIANNHVHDCGGQQGDGIEIKQGSYNNWVVGNHVHDTQYPCILAYGTGGKGINLIERNVCYRSNDNTMQVQGEAIVRNNLLMAASGAGFASTDHQGKSTRLTVTQNTIISSRRGANLSSWNDRQNMIFANNAVYTNHGDAIRLPQDAAGVTLAGNVVTGKVSGTARHMLQGNGLSDFNDVSWDAMKRNAMPTPASPLIGTAAGQFSATVDLRGHRRKSTKIVGAFVAP